MSRLLISNKWALFEEVKEKDTMMVFTVQTREVG